MRNTDYTCRVESLGESKPGNQISTTLDEAFFLEIAAKKMFIFIIPSYKIKVTPLFNRNVQKSGVI